MNDNNNKLAFDKILAEDEEYFEFADNESFCTACKLELDEENLNSIAIKQENSIHFENNIYSQTLDNFNNCPELKKATRSLSRISLDQSDLELAGAVNNQEDQTNHQPFRNNVTKNNDNTAAAVANNSMFNYSPSFICTGVDRALEILEKEQNVSVKKNTTVSSAKNTLTNNAAIFNNQNKLMRNKEIQTDLEKQQNESDNPWVDNEFISEEELEKIDHLINEQTNGNIIRDNKRKCEDPGYVGNNPKKIKVGAKEWNKTDYDSMVSNILKREKKCLDCSNDLYEYSEYLDDIRRTLLKKTPATNIEIPTPPVLVGYDNHFDFKNDKRFVKLPIQKIKIDSNKTNGINGGHNSANVKPKIYLPKPVASNQGPGQKNRLSVPKNLSPAVHTSYNRINKQDNYAQKNTLRQSTIKEAFAINKENHIKSINNKIGNGKVNANSNNIKNLEKTANGDAGKDNVSDSSSMYNYNPFRQKNNIKK